MTTALTETAVSKLEPGKTICDHRFKGLMAIGRKSYTTYAYQTDLRRNGRFVRTVRVTLGRSTDMTIKEEKIRSGVDPNAEATSAKELLRSKNLIVRLLGEQLERVEEPTFQFSPTIDAFSDDDEMFVVNRSNFEHIFRYEALLRASANESIDAIHDTVPIANLNAFRATCHGHLLKLKKLRNISQKGYLGDLTLEILQATITRYELNIEINDQGEFVFETADPWAILKLLDDSY